MLPAHWKDKVDHMFLQSEANRILPSRFSYYVTSADQQVLFPETVRGVTFILAHSVQRSYRIECSAVYNALIRFQICLPMVQMSGVLE